MPSSNSITCLFFILIALHTTRSKSAEELYHAVEVSSLLHQHSCNPSAAVTGNHFSSLHPNSGGSLRHDGISLEAVHRHGPCSKHKSDGGYPTLAQILQTDQGRVQWLNSRVGPKPGLKKHKSSQANLPAKSGSSIGSGNYIVTVGLGTPKKDQIFTFDTGSDFTWAQCQPCAKSCYPQQDPIFNPRQSTSYANVSCDAALCSVIRSTISTTLGCSAGRCIYGVRYGDSSSSIGYAATDTLTLSPTDFFTEFVFGCGEDNEGQFKGSAGVIGLGRKELSAVSQLSSKYGKYFSYCLPTTSSTGHLTFGKARKVSKGFKYTPLLSNPKQPTFYFLSLQGISVGGTKLSIPATVFSTAGTVIDSGTVISRLPPAAYSALKSAFRQQMSKYPKASAYSILDTCYDFSGHSTVTVPKIVFLFAGGAEMDLSLSGILIVANGISQVCLAFAGNRDPGNVGILGNTQQKTLDVIYDVDGGKLGFAAGGCS